MQIKKNTQSPRDTPTDNFKTNHGNPPTSIQQQQPSHTRRHTQQQQQQQRSVVTHRPWSPRPRKRQMVVGGARGRRVDPRHDARRLASLGPRGGHPARHPAPPGPPRHRNIPGKFFGFNGEVRRSGARANRVFGRGAADPRGCSAWRRRPLAGHRRVRCRRRRFLLGDRSKCRPPAFKVADGMHAGLGRRRRYRRTLSPRPRAILAPTAGGVEPRARALDLRRVFPVHDRGDYHRRVRRLGVRRVDELRAAVSPFALRGVTTGALVASRPYPRG